MKTKLLGDFDIYINDGNYGEIYPEKEQFKSEGIPFISASDFSGRVLNLSGIKYVDEKLHFETLTKGHLKKGDVIIVVRGNGIGKVGYYDKADECNLNAQLAFIRTNEEELNSLYLFYLFSGSIYSKLLRSYGSGSAQPQLPINRLKLVPVVYQDIYKQRNIANVLSTLDAKIESNNHIVAELEKVVKTVYGYWFIQFDFSNAQGKPYKALGGKMTYNKEVKRDIPVGWDVKPLSELTAFISRGISPKYTETDGICVLNQKCIRNRTVLYTEARRNDNEKRNAEAKRVELYDVLVNSTGVGTLGRVAVVNRLPEDFITVDSHVTIVRANEESINKFYFAFSLLEKQKEIERYAYGSTGQVELSRFQLESLKVIVPPAFIQKEFESLYKFSLEKIATCQAENQQLATLRDWLLPMLMNGQVTVKGAEEKVSELGVAAEPETGYKTKINL